MTKFDETLAQEFSVKVGTGETRTENGKQVGVFKTFRTFPKNWSDDVLARVLQLGLNRIAGQLLNTVTVENGMKAAALERIIDAMNAGELPDEFIGQRAGSKLDTLDARIAKLAGADLIEVGKKLAIAAKSGTGKDGRVLTQDAFAALKGNDNVAHLIRALGDGLAFDNEALVDWARDDARKRDYVADAKAELAAEAEAEAAVAHMSADDLLGNL